MKKSDSRQSESNQENKLIEKALRTGGFLFPQTVEEVNEYERIYGSTDIILPSELQEPSFLFSNQEKGASSKVRSLQCENFAVAAREGSPELPKEIQQRIINDIKKTELRRKRKK